MEQPVRLVSPLERPADERVVSLPAHAVPVVQELSSASNSVTNTISKPKSADILGEWKSVNAIVIGNHEIPHRTAMHIPVSVPNATVGCDICLKGPSQIKALAVESTLNTVREGNRTLAFVANTTDGPIKLKQGVFLSHALPFNGQVMAEPVELPPTCISAVYILPPVIRRLIIYLLTPM